MTEQRIISYLLTTIDNATPVIEQIDKRWKDTAKTIGETEAEAAEAGGGGAEEQAAAQMQLADATERATESTDRQKLGFVAHMESIRGLRIGVMSFAMSMETLGLVSGKSADQLRKVSAGLAGVIGMYQMFRSAIWIANALRDAEIGLAVVETFRAALKNPAALALVGVAGGAAIGAGAALMGRGGGQPGSQVQTTYNANIYGGETIDRRQVASDALRMMGA